MYLFGFINLFGMFVCFSCIPSEINQTFTDDEIFQIYEEIQTIYESKE